MGGNWVTWLHLLRGLGINQPHALPTDFSINWRPAAQAAPLAQCVHRARFHPPARWIYTISSTRLRELGIFFIFFDGRW